MQRYLKSVIILIILTLPFTLNAQLTYDTLDLGNGISIPMVLIPPGTFMMGPDSLHCTQIAAQGSWYLNQVQCPQHQVTITKPYWLGVTEVTQAQFAAIMGDSIITYSTSRNSRGPNYPAYLNVSPTRARDFCSHVAELTGKPVRLPTDAEWEYACRAGTTTKYFWGETTVQQSLYVAPSGDFSQVGSRQPNPWGLYDIAGNVWEYVGDNNYTTPTVPETDPNHYNGAYNCAILRGGGILDNWYWSASRLAQVCGSGADHTIRVAADYTGTNIINNKTGQKRNERSIHCSPNPFNPSTTITINGLQPQVRSVVKIYNGEGSLVTTLNTGSSEHAVIFWNAANLPSGMYYIRAVVGSKVLRTRALLLK
ncbi:MAG: hypothetical protein A2487_02375 [Candidatus Raymondbacteria bacterium RifOxyC12_full_50_8]|uniref:Sulfatase-modifying factor enzyme-like domain-containing protein n=1 Tax=Candidatus Raymondbacteria bacterium RIFOXYD12_FULL_49_13 TaxID=1817890 RepID=A0A1F7FIF9_UNCRA|nr:MAG: hypothetical protein A2248_20920 [Candidatus Raymondbacteria bacterium RIFOXYA2_FULL_49_16]OGJ99523.1 MAG: hypothetical protein A2350_05485 [Candidatus Raymondbacteria bacterium RifOxyB12_full_50_8]OGK06252.1 MAG: hypothetical protein A2519_08235 [Candidatus Raymondbacteria bacterium RIFOXYD12_FULL_49_13]OGK07709.1 MAG: hypothetical protein A2487_02375 [Candidatus Raymondbacteria bacterium RifOxyC12_full_50_8]